MLLVPIAANGVILYIIQLYFQSKLKHNEHKNEVKQKINAELFSLLVETKSNFRALGHCIIDNPEDAELFNQNLAKFNISIRKALDYYNDYSFYLKDYSSNIAQLESVYDKYVAFGRNLSTLNKESKQQFQDYLNQLFKLICDATERYLKEI